MSNGYLRLNSPDKKIFVKKALAVFIPVTIQNLLGFGLNIVDTMMIGRVGVDPLAAVGASNQIYVLLSNITYGLLTGLGAFVAQFYGAGDTKDIKKVMGITYKYSTLISLIFMVLALLIPGKLIWLFARDEAVIGYGIKYLRIVSLSYAFTTLSFSIVFASRCIQKLRVTTIISATAIGINTGLNYVLIYGKLGLPALGVEGAALATLTARIIECLFMFLYVYKSKDHPLAGTWKELNDYTKSFRNHVLKTAGPVVLSDGSWGITTTVFLIEYGLIGSVAVAAVQIINLVGEFCQAVFYGLGNATAVLLGEKLGKGDIAGAEKDSKIFLSAAAIGSVIVSVIMYVISPAIADWYRFDAETTAILLTGLKVTAVTIIFRMMCYIIMCGVLRSGGDTKACLYIDMGYSWGVAIPCMFIGIVFFNFSLPMALMASYISELMKSIHSFVRYRSKKWQRVFTEEDY